MKLISNLVPMDISPGDLLKIGVSVFLVLRTDEDKNEYVWLLNLKTQKKGRFLSYAFTSPVEKVSEAEI